MKLAMVTIWLISGVIFQTTAWKAPTAAQQLKNPIEKGDAKSIAKGKKIYAKICWTCHGLEGKGDGPAGVSLTPKPASFGDVVIQSQTDGEVMWKISHGKGSMPAYEDLLSEQQRWQLVSYIRTLNN